MTRPLQKPPRKDPQKRTRTPLLPPAARSRAALGLAVMAGQGRFALQHCTDCEAVQYPPRDVCHRCLSNTLVWTDTDASGVVLAETTIRVSPDPYFRERMPWRMGAVRLTAGPTVNCHLHGEVQRGDTARMALKLDKAGQGVLVALPKEGSPLMQDDPILRAMSCDPKHRRVLITDARATEALPLAQALLEAGAAHVFVGESESWRRWKGRADFEGTESLSLLPLDVTDVTSLKETSAEIGGKTDILINTARFIRPGGVLGGDTVFAGNAMDVNAMGLMRLAQAFGPGMAARTEDGVNAAAAFVNILSVQALTPQAGFSAFGASQAAARSVSHSLRGEFRASGLRVMNVYTGAVEGEDWTQPVPPPKVTPQEIARAVVAGLRDGLEEVPVGDVAKDIFARWQDNAMLLEREMTGGSI